MYHKNQLVLLTTYLKMVIKNVYYKNQYFLSTQFNTTLITLFEIENNIKK